MARQPNVTGQGARWAAQGLAAQGRRQEKAQVSAAAQRFSHPFAPDETAPPTPATPTGTEHLSGAQFPSHLTTYRANLQKAGFNHPFAMKPNPTGVGGKSIKDYGSDSPAVRTYQMGQALSKTGGSMWGGPTLKSGGTTSSTRGYAAGLASSATSKKAGRTSGRIRNPIRVHASRFAGNLAGHLRTATKATK